MQKIKFNDSWKVWKDLSPFELVFRVPDDAVDVTLPYDAMFHETQTPDSKNGGSTGFLDGSEYKYYKKFFVPQEYEGGHVFFQFEGIYRNASVFINKSLAGQCAYGYTDFFVDAKDYLKYGEDNEILVTVKCGTRSSRWYSGGGIYKDVYMHQAGVIYLKPYGLRMHTVEVEAEGALVNVSGKIVNDSLTATTLFVNVTMKDANGTTAVNNTYPVRIKSHETIDFERNVYVENALLWSDETANLYTIEMTISDDGGVIDSDCITSGIRKLVVDSRHGLRVNGKVVKLRGACIHHDQGLLGAATYDDYEYRRVRQLKASGFNAVRSAHNPASQALMRACDKLGVYVMDELVDVWNKSKVSYDYSVDFERCWEADVTAMVNADYNHPSVIMYSTGNEIFEICSEKGFETSRMLGDKFHELDRTRYVTNGINGAFAAGDGLAQIVYDITDGQADTGKGDVNVFMGAMETNMPGIVSHKIIGDILEKLETTMDIIGYNYMTARYLPDAKKYPDRVMVGTETYPKQIAENWDAIMQCPAAIGDFTWTGYDYMGEVRPPFPNLINAGADVSMIGNRRPTAFYREIVFSLTKQPCIAVQHPNSFGIPRNFGPWCYTDCTFSYNYAGHEGENIMIEVFAGGDSVELFVNNKSLGVQPCGKATAFETKFNTVYEPGELVAVAYENGQEIGRTTLKTTKAASVISAIKDEDPAYNELSFIAIDLLDEDGLLVADADNMLEVCVEGPARLLGFGSTGSVHKNGFEAAQNTAQDGHALVILKRLGKGDVKVTVSGEGLMPAAVEL